MCNEFLKNKFNKTPEQYIEALDELITNNKDRIVAIGELGLDYDRLNWCDKDTQKRYVLNSYGLTWDHQIFRNATGSRRETQTAAISTHEKCNGRHRG